MQRGIAGIAISWLKDIIGGVHIEYHPKIASRQQSRAQDVDQQMEANVQMPHFIAVTLVQDPLRIILSMMRDSIEHKTEVEKEDDQAGDKSQTDSEPPALEPVSALKEPTMFRLGLFVHGESFCVSFRVSFRLAF